MLYKFPTKRASLRPKFDQLPLDKEPEEAIGLIKGIQADSTQEWWVAKALNRIKIDYEYQYPVAGSGRSRGSYKVDFVVMTQPLATMIEPIGNHWHTGELGADDRKRQADIEDAMKDFCRIPILLLWIPDLLDEETVYQKLRSELA